MVDYSRGAGVLPGGGHRAVRHELGQLGCAPRYTVQLCRARAAIGPHPVRHPAGRGNNSWTSYQAITFTAAPGEASFTFPLNAQSGIDPTKAFTWSTIPEAQGYIVVVGTSGFGTDVANSGVLSPTQSSFSPPILPTGKTLYAALLTKVNGAFTRYQAITFTAGPAMGTFTHPVNGHLKVVTPGAFS